MQGLGATMKHKQINHGKPESIKQIIDVSISNAKSLIQGLQQLLSYMNKGNDLEKLYAACNAMFICDAVKDDKGIPLQLYKDIMEEVANGNIKPLPENKLNTKH